MTDEANGSEGSEQPPPRPAGHPEHLPWPPKMREYPQDHPARIDEESKESFNEDWARKDFGDAFINSLKNGQMKFRGDWWLLALLRRCEAVASEHDPTGKDAERLAVWNEMRVRIHHQGVTAHLEAITYGYRSLQHINLVEAHLEHAHLVGAHFEHANLFEARLEHAKLPGVHLDHARLQHAHLEQANLQHARLDHADVRGATGILFDSNPVERLHIEENAPDPWSRLRWEYTGPRFFFHLILLIAFLLPFAARVLHLSALAEVHDVVDRIVGHAGTTLEAAPGEKAAEGIETLRTYKSQFEESHHKVPAAWVLIGGTKGWLFVALTIVLLVYNGLRLVLTSRISALRDAEERSRITPAKSEYLPLHLLHGWATWLLWIAVASFAINALWWACTTWVWVATG